MPASRDSYKESNALSWLIFQARLMFLDRKWAACPFRLEASPEDLCGLSP